MFGKKKNKKELMDIFNVHLDESEDYEKTNKLYTKIKKSYQDKIKEKDLDIKIEKIRVQRKLGKYMSFTMSLYISLFILAISTLFNSFIQAYMISNNEIHNKIVIIILSSLAFYGMILYLICKNIDNDKERAYVYNVCLKVLEDIENETNRKKLGKYNKAMQEVAASKDAKRKAVRRIKKKVVYYY